MRIQRVIVGAVALALLSPFVVAYAYEGNWSVEERASVTAEGDPAPWGSDLVSISADGEVIGFVGGLVLSSDQRMIGDPRVMLYPRGSGATTMVPADLGNTAGDECWGAGVRMSANGRYVLINSLEDLVPEDTNGRCDTYVYDRVAKSFDGILIGRQVIWMWDAPMAISGDGRFVALAVVVDESGDRGSDVIVLDRLTGDSESVFVLSPDDLWLSIDGSYLAFRSEGSDVVLLDRSTGTQEILTTFVTDRTDSSLPGWKWFPRSYVFSQNMRFVAYTADVYVDAGEYLGESAGRSIIVHDRETGTNTEITVTYQDLDLANVLPGTVLAETRVLFISNDGQVIYFLGRAGGMLKSAPPPQHLFVLDRTAHPSPTVDVGVLDIVDLNQAGEPGDAATVDAVVSSDGSVVALVSLAGNLMPGEVNNLKPGFDLADVFVSTSPRFTDTAGTVFSADIEWLASEGITKGCNPPANDEFCPDANVTRGQMAAFLVRALGLSERLPDPFTDDDASIFEADIERLAAAGITKGCNPPANDRFCPDSGVSREQMAAFLVRAMKYADDGGGDLFVDDDGSIFEADIDRLATAGVTKGCNPPLNDRFCPDNSVTRGQMAAFLHRALG